MRTLLAGFALFVSLPALSAGILVDNVTGYTLDGGGKLKKFEALAVSRDGRVLAAGTREEARAKAPAATRIDGRGRTLLPGLIDAHGHVLGLGDSLTALNLRDTRSLKEAQDAIARHAKAHPAFAWVRGRGWNQEVWKLGRFPTAKELDAVTGDKPAWLVRVDGHAGWANTRALALAGITRDTADPPGGRIERDADGQATGVLVDAAMGLVQRITPPPAEAEQRAALTAALAHLAANGITGVHDMGVGVAADRLYRELDDAGRLTARVHAAIGGTGRDWEALSREGPLFDYKGRGRYSLSAVKLFADGALGSRGAALLAPYQDAKHTTGLLFHTDDTLTADMAAVMGKGYQLAIHAIGDAANRQVLDVFEALMQRYPVRETRHRIEHAQVVAIPDIARFAKLGIIASVEPIHATSDMNMAEDRVGGRRIKGAYAWRSLVQAGARLACGSDFPVEPANPFLGLHAAVTRQDIAGNPPGGWYPNEALSLVEALACFTRDAAWASRGEEGMGTLTPGARADFILVDRDIFRISPHDLPRVQVLETWLGGVRVFRKHGKHEWPGEAPRRPAARPAKG